MNENWRDIQGYEGYYQISDRGRIRNRKEKVLKFRGLNGSGYRTIELHRDGVGRKFRVHRLVAETFIPNPDNLPCVNHKDEDKLNNDASNLEWCTHKYNSNYGTRNKRIVETRKKNGWWGDTPQHKKHKCGWHLSEETKRKISESQKRRLLRAQTLNEQLV